MKPPRRPSKSTPPARRSAHIDRLHGIVVEDPYRWMEEIESPETVAWIEAQRTYTEDWLSSCPQRREIRERIGRLSAYERIGLPVEREGRLFYLHHDGARPQPTLDWSEGDADPKTLVDPNDLTKDGTIALIGFSPSPDGRLVAYGLSEAGSDWQTWRIRDVESGRNLEDEIRAQFAGPAWARDGRSFVYLHTPPPTGHWLRAEAPVRSVAIHRLGTPQCEDLILYTRPDEPDWIYRGQVTDDGRYVIVTVARGTHPERAVALIDFDRAPLRFEWLLDGFDGFYSFLGSRGSRLFFQTTRDAPRGRIVEIDLASSDEPRLRTLVPQTTDILEYSVLAGGRLVCSYLQDAAARIEIRSLEGKLEAAPELPGVGTVLGMTGRNNNGVAYLAYTDVGRPETILRLDVATGRLNVFQDVDLPFDPSSVVTERRFYESPDGTRIPLFVSRSIDTQAGPETPTILYAYGGYGASETPTFRMPHRAWLDLGGQLAVACIRGGGEYGEAWHRAGIGKGRPTTFADYCAAAEWLIEEGRTSRPKLVASGRSNGGLLVGACMTMRPDLFGAALPAVGVHDMLRFHRFTVGRYWVSDYGSPDDPEMFPTLYGYSPLHNVREGVAYPPTLVLTADHDDRVYPAHSFKFGAALQYAQTGETPILVRIDERSGHGMGKPMHKVLDEIADTYAFLTEVLNFEIRPA